MFKGSMKKLSLVIVLTILFSQLVVTNANTLKSNSRGFWLEDKKGKYYANTWELVDFSKSGIYYNCYFGNDGYMYINRITPDGYYVNQMGAKLVNGVPETYTQNMINRTTYTSDNIVDIGMSFSRAISELNRRGILYTTPKTNYICYTDNQAQTHTYYFVDGYCVLDMTSISCDLRLATYKMVDEAKYETNPLVSHSVEGQEEYFIYISEYQSYAGEDRYYYYYTNAAKGRFLFRYPDDVNKGWYTYVDAEFDMDLEDLITFINKM